VPSWAEKEVYEKLENCGSENVNGAWEKPKGPRRRKKRDLYLTVRREGSETESRLEGSEDFRGRAFSLLREKDLKYAGRKKKQSGGAEERKVVSQSRERIVKELKEKKKS